MSNIKINDVFQRIQYAATNGQTQFTIPFPFFDNAYVTVWQDGVVINQGAGAGEYGISGAGSPSGGLITLVTPAALDSIITIEGIMPIDRTSIYSATISNLTGSDLNGDFNREVVMMKQIETTQALLQLQYAPWAIISQDDTVTIDRYIPLLPPLGAWRMNAGHTAIETFLTPASGTLAPGDSTYLLQVADSDLPNAQAMGALASGLVVNTATTGVQLTRILTGTTNQVSVANGSGIAGNPTLSLSSTLDFPGTFTVQNTIDIDAIINDDTMATATATNLATALSIKNYVDGLDAGNVKSVSGTANRITSTGGANPVIDIAATYVGQTSITTLGTIATGIWQGTVVGATYGGTGVNNGSNTLTLAGALQTVGAHAVTFTFTGVTGVTFPTSGTLATVGATVSSITGTANQITASAPTGAVTLAISSNPVIPGTGGMTLPTGTTAQQAGIAGTIRFNSQTLVFESTGDGATWNAFSSGGGSVLSVSGTANQVEVDNTNPNTPIVLMPNVLDIPGTFNIQSSTAVDEIINDNSLATATATNLATALSIKTYIDAIAAGFHLVNPVRVATTAALTGTYANGTAGVGATFTMTALGSASIDSVSLALNDRVLIKNQASTFQNGVYYVSVVGDGGTAAVYTRATDFDTPTEINPGDLIPVLEGTVNQYTMWLQTATVVTIGVDAITFVQFGASFANVVTIAGTQTITGDKTFSGLVAVPTPTTGTGAANKNYVDASNNYSYLLMGG